MELWQMYLPIYTPPENLTKYQKKYIYNYENACSLCSLPCDLTTIFVTMFGFFSLFVCVSNTSIMLLSHFSRVRLFATPWITAHQAPGPSPTPRVHPDSRPLSQWCHPAISSSVVPFSSCPQFLPASGSFPMSQLLLWLYGPLSPKWCLCFLKHYLGFI